MKEEIKLTGAELALFKKTGACTHSVKLGGIPVTFYVVADNNGWPVVSSVGVETDAFPLVNFAGALIMSQKGEAPYKK